MLRILTAGIVLLASLSLLSCQKYTSGLVQSAARGDEAVVFSNLRAIILAENAYNLSNNSYGTFQQLTDGGYLDGRFKGDKPSVKEYVYTINVTARTPGGTDASYTCNADPERTGGRAGRHFYIDSTSNDIHMNPAQPATAADEVIKP